MPPGWQPQQPLLETGIPWESSAGGLFSRWWATINATLKGRPFFATAAQSDDAMSAVTFHTMTFALIGGVLGLLYFLLVSFIGTAFSALFAPITRGASGLFAGGAIAVGIGVWLVMVAGGALTGFVMPWVTAGVHHLVLALVGGVPPDRSYAHTVRAHAYAQGGAMVFSAVPYLGALVTFAIGIKNHLEAYDEMHHCGGGKALLAYFSPLLCSCCGCSLFSFLFGSILSALPVRP